jgi:conjugal transfer pilus assembly protein TraU
MMKYLLLLTIVIFYSVKSVSADMTCPDAEVLSGKLITDVCWDCMYPIRVAGVAMGGGSQPSESVDSSLCACNDSLGIPRPGVVGSMWEPARLVEIVRGSGCAPSLGGIKLPLSDITRQGQLQGSVTSLSGAEQNGFLHYHYYAFPLTVMMDMMIDGACNKDGFSDFDLMYFSEIDPTWNNEELAFFTHPEAAAVARADAIMACSADAAAAAISEPFDSLFWCAGSWGQLYPFSGNFSSGSSTPMNQNLLATRAVASLHRRGLARKTMGDGALCHASIFPTIPKTQYKLNYFFPEAEATSSHVIGEHDFSWGAGRVLPSTGEDAVLMLFRWNDCCVLF